MTKTFKVTVEVTGSKTYLVTAASEEAVYKMLEDNCSFDNFTNPIDDTVDENIIEIKENEDAH